MPNPLFNQIMQSAPAAQSPVAMTRLRANPAEMIRSAGYNVPEEIAGNPQAAVMHLLQTGQIGGPLMQRIRPMIQMLTGGR